MGQCVDKLRRARGPGKPPEAREESRGRFSRTAAGGAAPQQLQLELLASGPETVGFGCVSRRVCGSWLRRL